MNTLIHVLFFLVANTLPTLLLCSILSTDRPKHLPSPTQEPYLKNETSIMIQGIFYARFFPKEGPKIVAQSPPGCITATENSTRPPLIDFDVLQEYIIPRQPFCNRYVTINSPDGKYTILCHPVVIAHAKYLRNEFMFNFGLLVEANVDHTAYERVVRCLAATFSEMEKQNEYLSLGGDAQCAVIAATTIDEADPNARRPIESLLEIIKEDLNNYGECMIPMHNL
ncbi:hypothetical protein NQ176_g10439 [Zarea fungicola]|uniref:Uncharacterized protein n=1 Tax=Zarea fungicola TaxID=93591 RepID=A0ACC1MGA2_9HYPO|nr:hypothetical protein NQ176_g10439 [Lecanicillium fungicola]